VHYASDVIAGFCLGFMWLALSVSILNKIEKGTKQKFVELPTGDVALKTPQQSIDV
jgi:hypothetical protein